MLKKPSLKNKVPGHGGIELVVNDLYDVLLRGRVKEPTLEKSTRTIILTFRFTRSSKAAFSTWPHCEENNIETGSI